jgi:ATP phosphoribosyltransferase regulatory subunit
MRDLLPEDAAKRSALGRRVLQVFELHGYQRVSLPAFEYADVLERGLGALDPTSVIRFVEPETGEVVALCPDMTPQVARLVATRLADLPAPARLAYEGTVVRRRKERARTHQEIPQAGIELIGSASPEGDLEVIEVTTAAVRAAGLTEFVLDLGYASVAGSLLSGIDPAQRSEIVAALEAKDGSELVRRAERSGVAKDNVRALSALTELHGGAEIWPRAEKALGGTVAASGVKSLRTLFDAATQRNLAPRVIVDLGQSRGFAYYTGLLFQVLAHGPGRSVASGGRYDDLYSRFGVPRPAAGTAIDLDHLAWALDAADHSEPAPMRVLVVASEGAREIAAGLRQRGVACALVASETGAEMFGSAWRYGFVLRVQGFRANLGRIVSHGSAAAPGGRHPAVSTVEADSADSLLTAICKQLEIDREI